MGKINSRRGICLSKCSFLVKLFPQYVQKSIFSRNVVVLTREPALSITYVLVVFDSLNLVRHRSVCLAARLV
jgi:hypothetical protein